MTNYEFLKENGFPCLDITRLNGFSNKAPNESMRKLVLAIDLWIEDHFNCLSSVIVSKTFDDEFLKENGFRIFGLRTIVGDCVVVSKYSQKEEIIVL